jgi:hypothetical protein
VRGSVNSNPETGDVQPGVNGSDPKLLGVGTESRMFRPELVLSLLKPIYGRVELLQVCLILAHQVFDPLQEFFRGWMAGCHVGREYTPVP